MKLGYGDLLSPSPIALQICTIKKHKLREIAELSFERFEYYEILLKIKPEFYYTKIKGEEGSSYWDSLTDEERGNLSIFDIVISDEKLKNEFVNIFNFFFVENVVLKDNMFIVLDSDSNGNPSLKGVILGVNFCDILSIIQQICCIYSEEEKKEEIPKFKNSIARKIYEKTKAAKEERDRLKAKENYLNHSIPNIVSKVSNKHNSINPINVWDLTIFQLFDCFRCLQINCAYDISATGVSVWGDKEKKFDSSFWYANNYDKQSDG